MDQPIQRIKSTTFELVSKMNTAFGNPKGDPLNIDWNRVQNQCLNIPDEVGELFIALGADPVHVRNAVENLKKTLMLSPLASPNVEEVRDALCDISVFSTGAQHLMGIDGDRDMQAVIDGVMTRFIKDDADLQASIAAHASKGVLFTYLEGDYPTMILKSSTDQPDAPMGKFLKSASYKPTQFYKID